MNKRRKTRIGLLVLAGLLVYIGVLIYRQQGDIDRKQQQLETVQAKIEEQEQIKERLKKEKENIQSDEYAEKVAREQLGMVKPGERVYSDVNK